MDSGNCIMEQNSPIVNFYNGKSVFITGVTGFLGTVLLEKILYSCPGVDKIYVLIKPWKGLNIRQRLDKLFNTEAFQRLRKENPLAINKVIPINGNLMHDNLGLSFDDLATLQKEVSIVLHGAASINFNLSLKECLTINTCGTEKLLELAWTMEKLKSFVYISSAYGNCKKKNDFIEEKIYEVPTLDSVLYAVDHDKYTNNDELLEQLLDGRPNTYPLTKALTEHMIESKFKDMPIVILRPSIITSSIKEPVPGWVQGFSGINRSLVLLSKRRIRIWYAVPNAVVDMVPVDYVANITIAAAWDVHTNWTENSNAIKVYNYTSGMQNPISAYDCISMMVKSAIKQYNYVIPPFVFVIQYPWVYWTLFFLLQTLPAYILEGISILFLQKAKYLDINKKVRKLVLTLKFYTLYQFTFIDKNVNKLYEAMDDKDKEIFDFDIKKVNWSNYLNDYVKGIKKYLLKE